MTARFVVPPGESVSEHFCCHCGEPWDWCLCEADDEGDDE